MMVVIFVAFMKATSMDVSLLKRINDRREGEREEQVHADSPPLKTP